MDIGLLLKDKSIKPKEKTAQLSRLLLAGELEIKQFIAFTFGAKDTEKATCIEALEFASKSNAKLVSTEAFDFVCGQLASKAPRVKWESAKVIGNTIHLFEKKIDTAIMALLPNTEDKGTVVRWSAAYALAEVIKIKGKHQADLLRFLKVFCCEKKKTASKKFMLRPLKKPLKTKKLNILTNKNQP